MNRKRGYMDIILFKKIIDELSLFRPKPLLDFSKQGEPLLHPLLIDAIRHAAKGGFSTRLITNGTLLTKELSGQLISSGLNKIVFSISAGTKETFNKIHMGSNFDKVINNILDFIEIRGNKVKPAIRFNFVKEKRNIEELPRFIKFFSMLPATLHTSVLVNFFGKNNGYDLSSYNKYKDKRKWRACIIPWRMLSIGWDGKVSPCMIDYNNRYIAGDCTKESAVEIWNNKKMQIFREALINKNYNLIESEGKLCSECNQIWGDNIKQVQKINYSYDLNKTEFLKKYYWILKHRHFWYEGLLNPPNQKCCMTPGLPE